MPLLDALLTSPATDKLYVEDIFNTVLYTGDATYKTLTTTTDLTAAASGALLQGGMVWQKSRSAVGSNYVYDTVRGAANFHLIDTGGATQNNASLTVSGSTFTGVNWANGTTAAAWTFRRAQNFFDIVTWTGNNSNLNIAHSLGVAPGMIIVKRTDVTDDWRVYHRSIGSTNVLMLTSTAAAATAAYFNGAPTASTFGVTSSLSTSGGSYVAYLFAHDASADGVVQCGSFTTDASGNATVTLGWEPGWMLVKTSSAVGNWTILDEARGFTADAGYQALNPTLSNAEAAGGTTLRRNASGFTANGLTATTTYVYTAIRRGLMRVPTTATSVFSLFAATGATNSFSLGIAGGSPDMFMARFDRSTTANTYVSDRLRGWGTSVTGSPLLKTNLTDAEATPTATPYIYRTENISTGPSVTLSLGAGANPNISYLFRRAPGFFDQICYTGTGANATIAHNLQAAPTMMWVKARTGSTNWIVYHASRGATGAMNLNTTIAFTIDSTSWNATAPTSTTFTVGTSAAVNVNAAPFTAYLFGDVPGVSKAGSYSGSASDVTVNCGFAPRFVLIKRTDIASDWYIFDTARGIVAAADPYVLLNSTASEVTVNDLIDPVAGGFVMVGGISATNAAGGSYIYYAVS
jgi:hypothetical protein